MARTLSLTQMAQAHRLLRATAVLILFHAVGLIGLALPLTRPWFLQLVPFHLLLTTAMLTWGLWPLARREVAVLAVIAAAGFLVELLGVHTGWPFGNYAYGTVLGLGLFHVPLLIGLNWVLIITGSLALALRFTTIPLLQVLLAALAAVLIDVLIEPVAISLGFWTWQTPAPPLQNYAGWFLTALPLAELTRRMAPRLAAPVAARVWLVQAAFFAALNVLFVAQKVLQPLP